MTIYLYDSCVVDLFSHTDRVNSLFITLGFILHVNHFSISNLHRYQNLNRNHIVPSIYKQVVYLRQVTKVKFFHVSVRTMTFFKCLGIQYPI